jgi:long-chain acyl-CoA synthetase
MLVLELPADRQWLAHRMSGWGDRPALIWRDDRWSYRDLARAIEVWLERLASHNVKPGDVVAICGDFSPNASALFLACALRGNIVVPMTMASAQGWARMMDIAEVQYAVEFDDGDVASFHAFERPVTHAHLRALQDRRAPGLILFSSGSTGESKASALDLGKMLGKFKAPRPAYRTLAFLLMDHIGGINTLLHVFAHGGVVVTARDRTPDTVCAAIDRHAVQLLPTTPTFLRMLLISDAVRRYELKSLEIVTYGTEPMLPSTLAAVRAGLPWVRLKQTYGLSELGILPTYTRDSESLWLKLGDDGFQHKIVDGVLWIRSEMAMLGYLNAPSPFDGEGWMNTQDLVEVEGEFVRILGRKSEMINVGGEKVHPTEVEDVLLQIDNVREATVSARPNPVTGQVVAAKITLLDPEDAEAFKRRVRRSCLERLPRHKVPLVVEVVEGPHHSERFKKSRRAIPSC